MLKRGETDVAYLLRGARAEELRRTLGLTLRAVPAPVTEWLYFPRTVGPEITMSRSARAARREFSHRPTNPKSGGDIGSVEAHRQPHPARASSSIGQWPLYEYVYEYDPHRAKELLAEAGYPNGFDAGTIFADMAFAPIAEAIANYFLRAGCE
jgi:peptide/nickel transport system substrate-binding protein